MSAGFKHTAARVITSNRHMAATAIKGLNPCYSYQLFNSCELLLTPPYAYGKIELNFVKFTEPSN